MLLTSRGAAVSKLRAANDEEEGHACQPLPPWFPEEIRAIPLRVSVAIVLTEHNCIFPGFYEKYAANSAEEAMTWLISRPGENLVYRFVMSGASPAFRVDADWPLFRGREERRYKPRQLHSRGAPWDLVADRTVFEIRNDPLTASTTRMHLKVGGLDADDAARRWERLAVAVRELRSGIKASPVKIPERG
jgi:hypothetical protein